MLFCFYRVSQAPLCKLDLILTAVHRALHHWESGSPCAVSRRRLDIQDGAVGSDCSFLLGQVGSQPEGSIVTDIELFLYRTNRFSTAVVRQLCAAGYQGFEGAMELCEFLLIPRLSVSYFTRSRLQYTLEVLRIFVPPDQVSFPRKRVRHLSTYGCFGLPTGPAVSAVV